MFEPPSELLIVGDMVYYFDEDRTVHAAFVCYVHPRFSQGIERPICNLASFNARCYLKLKQSIEPAYHNGDRWILINKWAYRGEIPEEEFNQPTQV